MVKVRMNTADVAAEAKCLRKLIGMRCSNVYDLTPKSYMLKFMNSSGIAESGESEKVLLLMESGIRLHTTAYMRDKNTTPSGFALKLRKHIRTRRLEDVRQLGYDRVVDFQFGLGNNAHHLILELYAQGNILLTDSNFMVLTLLRSHRDDNKGLAIMSRHHYPVEACRVFERTTLSKVEAVFTSFTSSGVNVSDERKNGSADKLSENAISISSTLSAANKKAYGGPSIQKSTLKTALGEALGYGPTISEHIILDAGLLPNKKLGDNSGSAVEKAAIQSLAQAVSRFEDWLVDIMLGGKTPDGYILMQDRVSRKKGSLQPPEGSSFQIYDEFCPILLNQFKSRDLVKFDTFDAALDEFYSKIESQRMEQQKKAKEESAIQKLNKIRSDQENRVCTLRKDVDRCTTMAQLIEYNLDNVDAAILAVRVALANGMDWKDLTRMIKEEKKCGNPVAGLIDKLDLDRNCVTLLLSKNLYEMNDHEKISPVDKVEIDLALSAHANVCRWYELKKRYENKQEKTISAHEMAFKAAEKKTRHQITEEKTLAAITHMRKVHWFEKFNWFITSENYLVISGRDAQQNEMIVKRYMSKGDIYIHADLHGASSTVIKNHSQHNPIPPLTLNQAGCFTVCHSQAWDSKFFTSAWWVHPHQVSKTAPTGEYLTVGSFMIRGRKNFLPPHPLIMGFGLLFRLDETSLGSHLNERRIKHEADGSHEMEKKEPDVLYDSDEGITSLGCDNMEEMHYSNKHKPSSTCHDHVREDVTYLGGQGKEGCLDAVVSHLEYLHLYSPGLGASKMSSDFDSHQALTENGPMRKSIVRDKQYMSKVERRRIKKGLKIDMESGVHEPGTTSKSMYSGTDASVSNLGSSDNGKLTRGKRSKLKKIKEKYAEQDEEERKLRMALLASAGKPLQEDIKISEEKNETSGVGFSKICYKCKRTGHLSRDCRRRNGTGRGEDHVAYSQLQDDDIKDRVIMEEDDINEIEEEEKGRVKDVDYLTGNPLPSDILHYAVPVCGPYSALQSYKYHVKLTPGTVKKGKGARTALNLFGHMPEATTREKELMKACMESELVAAIIGSVKISAVGLNSLKRKEKKGQGM